MKAFSIFQRIFLSLGVMGAFFLSSFALADPNIDFSVQKSASIAEVAAGESITYTLTYSNEGTVVIPNATTEIKDFSRNSQIDLNSLSFSAIPAGDYCAVTVDPDPLVAIFQGSYIKCDIGEIAPGETRIITYTVNLHNSVGDSGLVTNTAQSTTENEESINLSNNSSVASVGLVPPRDSDLSLQKTANVSEVIPGEMVTYTVSYTNTGDTTATGITLEDFSNNNYIDLNTLTFADIPDGACGVTVDPDPLVAIFQGSYIFCDLPDLPAGDTNTFTYTVMVKSPLNDGTIIGNLATIFSDNETGGTNNNRDNVSVTVQNTSTPQTVDMSVTKTANKTIASPGEEVIYTLTYTNTGNSTATNIQLQDRADEGLDLSNVYFADVPANTCAVVSDPDPLVTIFLGQYIECDLPDLAAGESRTFTYTLNVLDNAQDGDTIENTATIDYPNDTNAANNSDSHIVTVVVPTPTPTPTATPTQTPTPTPTATPTSTPAPTATSNTHSSAPVVISSGGGSNSSSSSSSSGGGGGCSAEASIELTLKQYVKTEDGNFVEAESEEGALVLAKNGTETLTYKIDIINSGDASAYEVEVNSQFTGTDEIVQSGITNVNGATYSGSVFVVSQAIPANGSKSFTFEASVDTKNNGTASHTSTIQFLDKSYTCPRIKSQTGVGEADTAYFLVGDRIVETSIPVPSVVPSVPPVVEVVSSTGEAVRMTKSANKDTVHPGDEIIFTLSLTNTGVEDLKSVNVYDIFPSEYLEPTESLQNAIVDIETLRFKQKFLPIGATFTREVPMRVKGSVLPGTEIVNTMRVGTQNVEIKEEASVMVMVAAAENVSKPVYKRPTHIAPPRLVQTGLELPLVPMGIMLMIAGAYTYRRKVLV